MGIQIVHTPLATCDSHAPQNCQLMVGVVVVLAVYRLGSFTVMVGSLQICNWIPTNPNISIFSQSSSNLTNSNTLHGGLTYPSGPGSISVSNPHLSNTRSNHQNPTMHNINKEHPYSKQAPSIVSPYSQARIPPTTHLWPKPCSSQSSRKKTFHTFHPLPLPLLPLPLPQHNPHNSNTLLQSTPPISTLKLPLMFSLKQFLTNMPTNPKPTTHWFLNYFLLYQQLSN